MAGRLFSSRTACFLLDVWKRHRWESLVRNGKWRVCCRWTIGKRRRKSWTAWWAQLSTTPGYGRRASMAQVLFLSTEPYIANICHFKELSNFPIHNLKTQQEEENYYLELISLIQLQEIVKVLYFKCCIPPADAATFVYVNIFVRSFSKIDDVKMVSVPLILLRKWYSSRP